ncbi:carbohydrate ABC transporter permease [Tessaracoccus antarcticus]|uniref:Sugar ABC transporter permease n=1 Tax=Tessaracoccus antarcticus TaxID=2479848 RepID=A0A3M0G8J6_9ACTN|nr:sugar ABC transporter permease [Tessaracoccus antarcticus]RMB61361.1 sugar ABC transporter permease [Tessaracoccus antarcticus]
MTDTAVRPPVTTRKKTTTIARTERREAIALVIPATLPILIFSVFPLINGIVLAFTDATLRRNVESNFVAFDNFARLVGDTMFWESFRIGLVWSISVTVLQLVAGMGLALLLNADLRLKGFTRVLALVPWAMPPVVVAIMWKLIYRQTGPLNAIVSAFGGPTNTDWLANFDTALPAVIVVGVWVGMPQTTITLLAGLQQVPMELHEAAQVDGANAWNRFWKISIPSLRPIVAAITSLNFIWNFNSFGLVYVMTEGGPGGRTMLPMLFTYLEAFKSKHLGYAAAMGLVLVVFVLILMSFYLWSQFRKDKD